MEKRIIFLDLDGTLLCDDKTITKRNEMALHNALLQGHYVAITTGRSFAGGGLVLEQLGLRRQGCFLLAFNGGAIMDCETNDIIYNCSLQPQKVEALMKALQSYGIYCHTYNEKEILTWEEHPNLLRYQKVTQEPVRILHSYEELYSETMTKVIAIDYETPQKLHDFKAMFEKEDHHDWNCFFSCPYFVEFCRADANKGSGLEYLAQYLEVPIAQTIAVGDERNDLSMIQRAGLGVAMKNGREEVVQMADYVTTLDNNHSGVAEVIEKFMLHDKI